ncbi:MAG: glucose-6-phosphate dehydrogenase assembly protein OpcA [Solirubrobacterales bacterium]
MPDKVTPEASGWTEEGTTVDAVSSELLRLHHDHMSHEHGHSAARTVNLIVAPCQGDIEETVEWAVARLGGHNASRTIILSEHAADRLDAKAVIKCETPQSRTGGVGLCHDVVTLTADSARLAHSGSLVAPLIVTGLPTVLWTPDATAPPPDPDLLDRSHQLVLDTTGGGIDALRNAAALVPQTSVRDIAWGRLDYWRAATAAAFDPEERLALLGKVDALDVVFVDGGREAALLYTGWVAARCGWKVSALESKGEDLSGTAKHGRRQVQLRVRHDAEASGCGGVGGATFTAGSEEIFVTRGAAADDAGDPFPVALRPIESFARGYAPAIAAAAELAQ